MIIAGRDIGIPEDLRWDFEDEESVREGYWQTGPGDVVLDIGCYVGAYTVPALIRGSVVIAVDPYAEYLDRTWTLCEANGLEGRLTTVCAALAEPGGYSQEFWAAVEKDNRYPGLIAYPSHQFTTLDDLSDQLQMEQLDWVKIDVEGAELSVLLGGERNLRWFHPRLLIEDYTEIYGYVKRLDIAGQCKALLADMNYQVETVRYNDPRGQTNRDFWVCT